MLAAGFIIPPNMRFSVDQMGYVYWDLGGIYGIREGDSIFGPKKGVCCGERFTKGWAMWVEEEGLGGE